MLLLKLDKGNILRNAVAPLVEMAEMGTLRCSSNRGILLRAMARDNSCMAELTIESSKFEHFFCGRDGSAVVNLRGFYDSLSGVGEEDSITINGDYQRLTACVENSRTHFRRNFGIDLIDTQITEPEIQSSGDNYDVILLMNSLSLRDIIRHMYFFGTTVSVIVTQTELSFSAVNEEVVFRISLYVQDNSEPAIRCSPRFPISMAFNLSHMRSFMNASLLSKEMKLCPSSNSLIFPIGELGNELGNIRFYMFGRNSS